MLLWAIDTWGCDGVVGIFIRVGVRGIGVENRAGMLGVLYWMGIIGEFSGIGCDASEPRDGSSRFRGVPKRAIPANAGGMLMVSI